MSVCLAGHDCVTLRPPIKYLLDRGVDFLSVPLRIYFKDLVGLLELPERGPGLCILVKQFGDILILVTIPPVVLVEELDDGKVFVPRGLVEGLHCLQRVAHRIEVHIVGGETLLELLIDVHIPDPLEHGSVEVRQRIPALK